MIVSIPSGCHARTVATAYIDGYASASAPGFLQDWCPLDNFVLYGGGLAIDTIPDLHQRDLVEVTSMQVTNRRTGKVRRLSACVGSTVVALTLVIAPLAAAVSVRPARQYPASLARCQAPSLVVWLDTNGNGAAGSTYYNLQFTNLSGSACELVGFPGVSAVGLGGSQVGLAAARSLPGGAVAIRLAPGATATSVIRLTDAANFPSQVCHEVMAAGLRVYPPGATASKLVPYPFEACSSTGATFLRVRAVEKGIPAQ